MPYTRVNDIRIYYEIQGDGEPLVLINGLGADITFITPIINALSKKYKVIAFDNRGAGRTDKPNIPYTMEMMATDSMELLQKLGISSANVMGISMGGRIALTMALKQPRMVKSLLLVSTSARGYGKLKMSWQFHVLKQLQWLPILKGSFAQPLYAHERQRQATVNFSCVDQLKELRIPTLLLHGKNDKSVPLALAEETGSRIMGSRLITFRGGHIFFLMRERQHFIDTITDFLDRQVTNLAPSPNKK